MEYDIPQPSRSYFFIGEHLFKVIKAVKTRNELVAWSFKDGKRVLFAWHWWKNTKQNAYTLTATAQLLDRPNKRIDVGIREGLLPAPHVPYNLKTGNKSSLAYYSEDQVLEIHSVFADMHKGHPRNDGIDAPAPMPSREDLINMMKNDIVVYVKNGDKYVPIWKAGNW
jgi:hypothetical protein